MPTNGMTIDSLNTVSSLTAQDEVPVWDKEASGEHTRKITAQNMTNSVKTLGSLVNTTEMNNAIAQSTENLNSTTLTLTGTGDYPIKIYETGDEDYKGMDIYDKNGVRRYQLTFHGGHLQFLSLDASGNIIVNTQIV